MYSSVHLQLDLDICIFIPLYSVCNNPCCVCVFICNSILHVDVQCVIIYIVFLSYRVPILVVWPATTVPRSAWGARKGRD